MKVEWWCSVLCGYIYTRHIPKNSRETKICCDLRAPVCMGKCECGKGLLIRVESQ